jgi:hypothetical protein
LTADRRGSPQAKLNPIYAAPIFLPDQNFVSLMVSKYSEKFCEQICEEIKGNSEVLKVRALGSESDERRKRKWSSWHSSGGETGSKGHSRGFRQKTIRAQCPRT